MDVIVELLQEGMYQGCFTRTHFTCKDSKPPVVFDPADELGQSLLVFGTQVEGAWVRGDVKRLPAKTEMALIRRNHKLEVSNQMLTRRRGNYSGKRCLALWSSNLNEGRI